MLNMVDYELNTEAADVVSKYIITNVSTTRDVTRDNERAGTADSQCKYYVRVLMSV